MIGARRDIPEMMDDPGVDDGKVVRALHELSLINRWLGGFRVSRLGVGRLMKELPSDRPVSVLDVGAGGSDLPMALAPLGRRFDVTSLDINYQSCVRATERRQRVTAVNGSALTLPFRDRSFDIAHASLFLHHCTDEEAQKLLADLSRVARCGVVINDLHRHPMALAGIIVLTGVLSRSTIVRHDAPASVHRAFLRSEIDALLPAGLRASTSISWHWAFRWCVSIALTAGRDHGSSV